ncbi:hypothetical protein [Bradyrhizobium sp. SZCCHNPS2010]|uniref:hypothetical protein n=1 Tax=Bradyrhizobium sp. SZCCHNPS2010 TaxID=3057333 RepID=UPI0029160F35|nr:hypothetical protein [Bradyrhizobium sp. SZCCHNPS2010]
MSRIFCLDDNGSIAIPAVGDAEIRSIEFAFPDLTITLYQPFDGSKISLRLFGMRFLYFHTDHPQNVIEKISVHESWDRVRLPAECNRNVLMKEFGSIGRYIVVIEAIAGGPLVCGARDFNVEVN